MAIEAITSVKTSIGATAFNAPTNSVPSRPVASAAGFEISASRIPKTRPASICLTRLPCVRRLSRPDDCMVIVNP
ncbi:hypothetical protein D3C80_1740440 [compost metagenome]